MDFFVFAVFVSSYRAKLFELGQARPGGADLAYGLVSLGGQAASEGVLSTSSGIFSGGLRHFGIPVIFGLITRRPC